MQQINKVRPSISPWKQNNRIAYNCMVGISLRINTSRSFDMQMWPLLFTDEKSISSLSNNSESLLQLCLRIVSKQTQSEILQFPFGNSLSIQILRDQSWRWAFATSFPGHCAHKASWAPYFLRAMLFNESMHKKCVSNLNLHLILNILWAVSFPPPHEGETETMEPTFVSLLFPCFCFTFEGFCSVFFLDDKSLTHTNKHNS